jgi:hypothetical protein
VAAGGRANLVAVGKDGALMATMIDGGVAVIGGQ